MKHFGQFIYLPRHKQFALHNIYYAPEKSTVSSRSSWTTWTTYYGRTGGTDATLLLWKEMTPFKEKYLASIPLAKLHFEQVSVVTALKWILHFVSKGLKTEKRFPPKNYSIYIKLFSSQGIWLLLCSSYNKWGLVQEFHACVPANVIQIILATQTPRRFHTQAIYVYVCFFLLCSVVGLFSLCFLWGFVLFGLWWFLVIIWVSWSFCFICLL